MTRRGDSPAWTDFRAGDRIELLGRVSGKWGEREVGVDWRFMGAHCSHPACQSKPLECFSCCATCVYSLVGDHSFVTCHKSVYLRVNRAARLLMKFY